MLLLILGVYYAGGVRAEARWLWRLSVPVRLSIPVFFIGFVLLAGAPPVILLFAGADVAAALWTAAALRREGG